MVKQEKKETPFNFWVFAVLSEILYLSFYGIWYFRVAFGDIRQEVNDSRLVLATLLVLLLLAVIYAILVPKIKFALLPIKHVFAFLGVVLITLYFLPPLWSNDVYTYVYRGRTVSEFGGNPYITPYDDFESDKLYPELKNDWSDDTTVYGPLFITLASIYSSAGDNVALQIFIYKTVSVGLFVGISFLLWSLTGDKKSLMLFGFNPLVLFSLIVDVHNDVYLLIFLALCLFLIKGEPTVKRVLGGWVFFVLSFLIKFLSVIFAPMLLIFIFRNQEKMWVKLVVGLFFTTLVVTTLAYLSYWEGIETFSRLMYFTEVRNTATAPGVLLLASVLHGLDVSNALFFGKTASQALFILLYGFLLYKIYNTRPVPYQTLIKYLAISFGLFLALFMTWLQAWYFVTFIFLASAYIGFAKSKMLERCIYLATYFAIIFMLFSR